MVKIQKLMPQEMEVWYLLPALRREIAKILINDYNFTQKKVAGVFGITESAVSQYLKSKRASDLTFSSEDIDGIKKSAKKINNDPQNYSKYLYDLSKKLKGTKGMCELHRKHDPSIGHKCDLCHR